MPIGSFLANVRWKAVAAISRRQAILRDSSPVVSFTFDDFPRSALEAGGARCLILEGQSPSPVTPDGKR